jgi:hypothetical protein
MDILTEIKEFLKDELKLNLSESKTLITNARAERATFLGTEIYKSQHQAFQHRHGFAIRANREIKLNAPIRRVTKKLTEAGFMKGGISQPKFL